MRPESGRYRLVWSHNCNWSNRLSILRELLKLEDAVSAVTVSRNPADHNALWEFTEEPDGRDSVTGARYLVELYRNTDPDFTGRATVPALVDITTNQVVSNSVDDITKAFEVTFRPLQKPGAPELYPEALRDEMDSLNHWLFRNINRGVYRCRDAQTPAEYDAAYNTFYDSLDQLEKRLDTRRFLFGDYVTDSDIRFFATMVRFDSGFALTHMGPTKHRLVDYENLWGYSRELWQIPAFRNNTFFREFSRPKFKSPDFFTPYMERFIDQIDFDALWGAPVDRSVLSHDPEHKLRTHGE